MEKKFKVQEVLGSITKNLECSIWYELYLNVETNYCYSVKIVNLGRFAPEIESIRPT